MNGQLRLSVKWSSDLTEESIGLSVQEKKRKIDFQDDGHLGFPTGTILVNFDLQVILMLPTQLQVNWPFGKRKIDFQDSYHGGHLGFPIAAAASSNGA